MGPGRARAAAAALAAALGLAAPLGAQEMPLAPRDDFGEVVVGARQLSGGDLVLEQMIGEGFDSEPAYTISERSIYRRLGRAVGRLDVLTDAGTGYCTAFIVSERHLVTNHHCVPGNGSLTVQAVQFVAGYVETGVRDGTEVFNVSSVPIEADKALDYAVLEVFGNPSREWGKLDLSALELTSDGHGGLPLLIIGHPIRLALHFSRKECRAALRNAVSDGKLRHTCDTLQGNSGSPVLSEDTRQVIALHHAGSASEGVNFAIPMSAIVEHSEVLRGLVEAAAPAPSDEEEAPAPPPEAADPCDGALAHFELAREIGTRGAYEGHLEFYGGCQYAGFAANLMEGLGGGDEGEPAETPEPSVPTADPCGEARAHFDLAREIGTRGAYESHLDLYGGCQYAGFASNLLERLARPEEPEEPGGPSVSPVPEPRGGGGSAEARARDMVARFHEAMEVSPEAVEPFYYDQMVVNGALRRLPEIMEGQRRSFARSPRREITLHPETLQVDCTDLYCRLRYENTSVTYEGGARKAERYAIRSSVLREGDGFRFTEVWATRCGSLSRC